MKQIGRTTDNKFLVSMSEDELRAFHLLGQVVQGKSLECVYMSDVRLDTNMLPVFTAIRLWIEQTDRVNQLQSAVDRLKKALGLNASKVCTCDPAQGEACSNCP